MRAFRRRADVAALRAVDRGTREEQEAEARSSAPLSDGTQSGVTKLRRRGEFSQGERDVALIERREREADVEVVPIPQSPEK